MIKTLFKFMSLAAIAVLMLSSCDFLGLFGGGDLDGDNNLSGTVEQALTLENGKTYTVTDDLTVNAALTIEPGTVLEFASDTRLFIKDGSISAVGTSVEPIIFRGQSQVPGFWKGIQVNSSNITNVLQYVLIYHTGSSELDGDKSAIVVEGFYGGALNLRNSAVDGAVGYGLVVQDGGSLQDFQSNLFQNISGIPAKVDANQVDQLDSGTVFDSSNTTNVVEISGTSFDYDATWPALSGGVPYRVLEQIYVYGTLTVEAGATIQFDSAIRLIIDDLGGIIANGTVTSPIVFTGVVETAGYWRGIELMSPAVTNLMDYTTVSFAGHPNGLSGKQTQILLDGFYGGQLTLTNSTVSDSPADGVIVENGATLTESGNTFTNITGTGIVYE